MSSPVYHSLPAGGVPSEGFARLPNLTDGQMAGSCPELDLPNAPPRARRASPEWGNLRRASGRQTPRWTVGTVAWP